MFSKALLTSAFIASMALQGYAHAAIAPALGVQGNPVRNDVLRADNNCGGANVGAIDSSTALPIANGVVSGLTITNFNAGADGSRNIAKVSVNTDGTGKNFVAATVTQNGNANPSNTGSEPLTVSLPAGTTCTGGANKNRCLLSLTTTAGFGNCVVLTSGNAGAANANGAAAAAAGTNANANANKKANAKNTGGRNRGGRNRNRQRRSFMAQDAY